MTTGRFIWPPAGRREGGDHGAGDAARAGAAAREAVRQERGAEAAAVWSAVERTWIGVVSSPLEARLREAGVSATGVLEGSDASCWRCGHDVGPHEVDGAGCARCRGMRLNWQAAVRVGPYRSGAVGRASDASEDAGQPWGTPAAVRVGAVLAGAIREVKYGRFAALGEELGRRLGVACRRRLMDVGMEGAMVVVVPVPTSWKRRLLRGIDHPRVIARGVAQELGCVMWSGLSRSERPSQTRLAASERGESVRGTMRLGWRARLGLWASRRLAARGWRRLGAMVGGCLGVSWAVRRAGKDGRELVVVVVDDVTTTGSTLREACRVIGEHVPGAIVVATVGVTSVRRAVDADGGGASGGARGGTSGAVLATARTSRDGRPEEAKG